MLVEVALERGIDRHLETYAGCQVEILVQLQFVLDVERKLVIGHFGQELRAVGVVGVGDAEGRRLAAVVEIVER